MTDNVDALSKLPHLKWCFNKMIKKVEATDDPLYVMHAMFEFEQQYKGVAAHIAEAMGGKDEFERHASEREYDQSFAPAIIAYRDEPDGNDYRRQYSTMDVKTQGMTSPVAFVGRS